MKKIILRILLWFLSFSLIACFLYFLFLPLYKAESVLFPFAITPFDIAKSYPQVWYLIKITYFPLFFISYSIIFHYLYTTFQKYLKFTNLSKKVAISNKENNNALQLLIGKNWKEENVFLKEEGLYQNIFITGTIGTRKNVFGNVSLYTPINFLSGTDF